jgi:hypothetical protein
MSSEEQDDVYKTPKKEDEEKKCPNAPKKERKKRKTKIEGNNPLCKDLFSMEFSNCKE